MLAHCKQNIIVKILSQFKKKRSRISWDAQVNNCKFDVWIQTSMCISNNFSPILFLSRFSRSNRNRNKLSYFILKTTGMHKFTKHHNLFLVVPFSGSALKSIEVQIWLPQPLPLRDHQLIGCVWYIQLTNPMRTKPVRRSGSGSGTQIWTSILS
jgi:hypothetical protein